METTANKRYLLGGTFILIGILLVLNNVNALDRLLPYYLTEWYMVPLLAGVALFATGQRKGLGIALTIFGGFFLIRELDYYYRWYIDIGEIINFWPIVFIAIGVSLIIRRNKMGDEDWNEKKSFDDRDSVDETGFFSGAERIITSQNFQGGKLTSIFGGTDLNLVNADLATGTNVLDVFVLFGGTDITVPSDMNVRIKVTSIFGGFSDERKFVNDNIDNEGKELVIKGLVLFGGGEVKSIA